MAFNSAHSGPEIDAAVEMLGQVQDARESTKQDLAEIKVLASQVNVNADQVGVHAAAVAAKSEQVAISSQAVEQAREQVATASVAAEEAKDSAAASAEFAGTSRASANASEQAASQSQIAAGISEQVTAEHAGTVTALAQQVEVSSAAARSDAQSAAASAQSAAQLVEGYGYKYYPTHEGMIADPQTRDAILALVDKDPNQALNGFWSWSIAESDWIKTDKQVVFDVQLDSRMDPVLKSLARSSARLAPKETITDKSSGLSIEVLAAGLEEAVLGKVGNTGRSAYGIDTLHEKLFDYFERIVGKRLTFSKRGVVSTIASFFHWDVTGDLSFKGGRGTEVSVSGSGVRLGVSESVGAEQHSAFRHRSGRLMSKLDHGLYTGDLAYIGSDFVAPNRPSDVPVVMLAQSAPERLDRIIQGCPSVAVVKGRIWVAFFGGIQNAHESMYDFQVLKYSDDGGSTWVEWAYWVQSPTVARLSTAYLHVDERGILWVFSGTDHLFSINPDDQLGCWAFSIKDPLADKPTVSSMWRASDLGFPGYLNKIDERTMITMQIQENMTTYQDRKGVHLFEFDPTCRSLSRVGRLPLTGNGDWQESSVVQLRSGRLMAMYRTTAGQMVCYSQPGEFNVWSTPVALSNVVGANAGSRACLRRTPKGNLILVYNNSSARQSMTIALLNDAGDGLIHCKLLDSMETSYPDVAFDEAGNILVVWDRNRTIERTIMMSIIAESDFVANGEGAAQKIIVVDNKKGVQ